jgi:hypothetical protein
MAASASSEPPNANTNSVLSGHAEESSEYGSDQAEMDDVGNRDDSEDGQDNQDDNDDDNDDDDDDDDDNPAGEADSKKAKIQLTQVPSESIKLAQLTCV